MNLLKMDGDIAVVTHTAISAVSQLERSVLLLE